MTVSADDVLSLLSAVPLAALGGAAFVRGVVGVAQRLRLPEVLVATTLAAFATSSPEMAVSSLAALAGKPGIGLGDALGSNVVNLGLVLGLALLFGPMAARLDHFRRDLALALVVPILTLILALDGVLSRSDGALLLVLFVIWLASVVRQAMVYRRGGLAQPAAPARTAHPWLYVLGGMAVLILAGRLFVNGASGIALGFGVRPYVVGATLVAIGTSLPELVTVLLSRLRGHDDVGLGTVLGSNLFNGLAIVGSAATIQPIRTLPVELGVAVTFGVITLLLVMTRTGTIPRHRGLFLLAAYAGFVWLTSSEALQR